MRSCGRDEKDSCQPSLVSVSLKPRVSSSKRPPNLSKVLRETRLRGENLGSRRTSAVFAERRELTADSYLRNTHIAQPATNTPPRNIAKQYSPYFTISRVVSRWVMPKTMEANRANTAAALK
jgi:hypothetical protein